MELKEQILKALQEIDPKQKMGNDTFYFPQNLREQFAMRCKNLGLSKNKVIMAFIKIFLEN